MRDNDFYLITGHHQGCYGKGGNHTHNDLLSFELSLNGEDLIIDAGTYVYTPDYSERNKFRSTRMHNVLIIDGQEQSPLAMDPFYFSQKSDIEIINQKNNDKEIMIELKLNQWIRKFKWNKKERFLLITDKLINAEKHNLEWNFHLAPHIKTWIKNNHNNQREIILVGNNSFLFSAPKNLNCAIIEDEVSPSYGVKIPAKTIYLSGFSTKDSSPEFQFKIESIK